MAGRRTSLVECRWGLHQIITMDGTPYCIFQEWELWRTKSKKVDGGRSLATMPNGKLKVVKLQDSISEDNMKELAGELL